MAGARGPIRGSGGAGELRAWMRLGRLTCTTRGSLVCEGVGQVSRPCPAFVTVAPGIDVHCTKPARHDPDEDVHQGRLGVTLPDGREQTAFLVWTTWPGSWDDTNLHRPWIPPAVP
jgi:hypothetical protein